MVIGLSWGTALDALVAALWPRSLQDPLQGVHVVQIIGALGTADPDIDGPELARRLARTFGGRYTILPAPLIVDSEATQRALIADGRVQATLAYAADMNLALVGIGTLVAERSSLVRSGYIRPQELAELEGAGAVGDVCAIHFDHSGHLVETASRDGWWASTIKPSCAFLTGWALPAAGPRPCPSWAHCAPAWSTCSSPTTRPRLRSCTRLGTVQDDEWMDDDVDETIKR